jgi:hypothetical protein
MQTLFSNRYNFIGFLGKYVMFAMDIILAICIKK